MKSILLGDDVLEKPIFLSAEQREAHMHVIGSSGSGKSKFLESLIREDVRNRQGFCLIDPHGTLYRDVLNYCAFHVLERDIILLDLSRPDNIVGFNPFSKQAEGDVSVQVDRRIGATMHAWGVANADDTPTLERTLRLIYTTLIERGLSFHQAQYLIDFNSRKLRQTLIDQLTSPLIRREWAELQQLRARDWRSEVLSAKNRLFRLLTSQTLAKFFSASESVLNIQEIIEQGRILLVNLAPSDHLSAENARVFGSLLVNEIFEVARRRTSPSGKKLKPFYLYLDEFQTFVSLDITAMLDQVRKYKVFTILAHQRFGQLDEDLMDAVITNCRIKAVFGGLPYEAAKMMAQELFINELDAEKIKVAIYQTKFWPVYSRDRVYTTSRSAGRSSGRGDNLALGSSSSSVAGEYFRPGDWFSGDVTVGTSLTATDASSSVQGQHTSETIFEGDAEGEADVPIFVPVPFRELSSIQFYSHDEQLTELTAALKEQFTRHCFIKIHEQKTQPMRVPFIRAFHISEESCAEYQETLMRRSGAIPAAEVERAMAIQDSELVASTSATAADAAPRTDNENPPAGWRDIIGRE